MKTIRPSFPRAGVEITEHVRVFARTCGDFVIYDRRLQPGEDHGVFADPDEAIRIARERFGTSGPKSPAVKMAKSDEEAFAGMARAMANGFARHEPAEDAELCVALLAQDRRGQAILRDRIIAVRNSDAVDRDASELEPVPVDELEEIS